MVGANLVDSDCEGEDEYDEDWEFAGGIGTEGGAEEIDWCDVDEDQIDCLLHDYVDALTEDLEDPDEELIAAADIFANGARSFAEARDIVRRMRVSRGYYPMARNSGFQKGKGGGKKGGKKGKKGNSSYYNQSWPDRTPDNGFWKP